MGGNASRDTQLSSLERRLGRRFVDRAVLEQALTHSSWAHENTGASQRDNERLEFLGDALLGFFVAERLYRDDPAASEGDLTRRKQGVVSMPALATAARRLDLGSYLLLGRGEETSGGREKESLLADAFEAVLGAIYLDGGIRSGRAFVWRNLGSFLGASAEDGSTGVDPKTELQERWQALSRLTPCYRIVATTGPAHAREFTVEVLAGDRVLATGRGRNRKGAEQDAAASALRALTGEKPRSAVPSFRTD
jgi:ribonuclease-3